MTPTPLAVAMTLLFAITTAHAQIEISPAGASNAAAASPGGIPPTMPGIAAGSTSPGGINGVPQMPALAPPVLNPNRGPTLVPLARSATPSLMIRSARRSRHATFRPGTTRRPPKHVARAYRDHGRTISICKGC